MPIKSNIQTPLKNPQVASHNPCIFMGKLYSPEVYSVSSKGPAAAPISAMAIVLGVELMRPQNDLGFHEMTLSFKGFTTFKKMVCKQSANTTNPIVSIVGYCRNPPQNVLKNSFCLEFPREECRTRQVQLPCRPWHPWSRRRSWKANWLGATDVEKNNQDSGCEEQMVE